MTRANKIAGKRYRFCVSLLNRGGCWMMDRRRVRTANKLNHCLRFVRENAHAHGWPPIGGSPISAVDATYMTTRFTK